MKAARGAVGIALPAVFKSETSGTHEPLHWEAPAGPRGHSPGRVGRRYEEVDDYAVTLVQTVLHHPGAKKAALPQLAGQPRPASLRPPPPGLRLPIAK